VDLRRLRVGEWLVAGVGVMLAISLFLPWFDQYLVCVRAPCPTPQETGWEAFVVIDVIVAVVAVVAIVLLIVAARSSSPSPAIAYEAMLLLTGLVLLAIVGIRLLSPPGDVVGRGAGAWLALAGAAGLIVASLVAMRDERPSRPGQLTDSTGVPVSAPREVETLAAPPRSSS